MKLFKANRSLDVAALWYPGTNCIFVKKLSPSINLQHTLRVTTSRTTSVGVVSRRPT